MDKKKSMTPKEYVSNTVEILKVKKPETTKERAIRLGIIPAPKKK